MAELKGTRTEANLQTAFAGESMARSKYTFFASKAKKDGYVQNCENLRGNRRKREGAREKSGSSCSTAALTTPPPTSRLPQRAKTTSGPTCTLPLPKRRVRRASTTSRTCLRWFGAIEKEHEERYRRLLRNVEDKLVFSRDGDCVWQCSNCGHIVVGRQRPRSARSARILKRILS